MHRLMSRLKKLIIMEGGGIFLLAILSCQVSLPVSQIFSPRFEKDIFIDAEIISARGVPAGFDVLRKAQKNIQHDLGLPETPSSESSGPGHSPPAASSPYIAGTLLIIALMGLSAFFIIVYRETRRLGKTREDETAGLSPEGVLEDNLEEGTGFPDFPNVSSLLPQANLAEFPSYELPRSIKKSGRDLAEKLDSILNSIRTGLGNFQEGVRLSLYHYDEPSGFPILLSLSSGKKYPDFSLPPQILTFLKRKNVPETEEESITGSFVDGTRVETISFPFYDGMGSLFFLFVSLTGEREIPEKWVSSGRKLAQDLRPLLDGYARIHYLPVTSTCRKDGGPDSRSVENRMIEEMVKGRQLETRFSLLFIRIVSSGLGGNIQDLNVFFRIFRDRLLQCLRSSDLMLSHDNGSFTLLLPETMRSEAHIVLDRAMDIFEEQYQRYGHLGLQFHSDLREIRPDGDEHPETILGRLMRLDVPTEGMEPHEYV